MPFHPLIRGLLVLVAAGALLLLPGCFSRTQRTQRSSSVVAYLYPKQSNPLPPTTIPVLRLPLRVGIAFVPAQFGNDGITELQKNALLQRVAAEFRGREYIESIEIVPGTYLQPAGGFTNLEQVRRMLNFDVVALVAFDQTQFNDDNILSLAYWTIVGAYLVQGNKNDTQTLMEAAVYDISSKHLLFRAAGGSQVKASSTLVNATESLRENSVKGYDAAANELIANLKTQLEDFRTRVRQSPGTVAQIQNKPGYTGGGSTGGVFVAAIALLALGCAATRRR